MAEQAAHGATSEREVSPQVQASLTRSAGAHPVQHGRPTSWATAVIVLIGFIIGGISLTTGPTWWLFWTGAGVVVVGGLFGAATRIFDDWY